MQVLAAFAFGEEVHGLESSHVKGSFMQKDMDTFISETTDSGGGPGRLLAAVRDVLKGRVPALCLFPNPNLPHSLTSRENRNYFFKLY